MKKVLLIITLFLLILPATVYGAPTSTGNILFGRLNPTMNGVQQSSTVDYKNVSKITITGSWSSYTEECDPSYTLQFYSGSTVINNSSGYLSSSTDNGSNWYKTITFPTACDLTNINFKISGIIANSNYYTNQSLVINVEYDPNPATPTPTPTPAPTATPAPTPPPILELTIDVTIVPEKIDVGKEFTADISLKNVKDIYAEDSEVKYDKEHLEYLGFQEVTGYKVYNKPVDQNGAVRFIVASQGEEYGINKDTVVLKLKFKAKAIGKFLTGFFYSLNLFNLIPHILSHM